MKYSPPEIPGIEFPREIVSWHPSERHGLTVPEPGSLMSQALELTDSNHKIDAIEYIKNLKNTYILPSGVSNALASSLESDAFNTDMYEGHSFDQGNEWMMREFEQGYLMLPPSDSDDGLHWYSSSAGFEAGSYQTEDIAPLFFMTPGVFSKTIREIGEGTSRVLTRSDQYIIPVHPRSIDEESVVIGGVIKLTNRGSSFVEELLRMYEAGLNAQ